MIFKKIIIGAVFLFALTTPFNTYAASATFFGPIVPAACHCDNQTVQGGTGTAAGGTVTTAPDYGCVMQVIQNVINFAISISIILFVLFLALSGFQLIISGGSPGAREKAKTRLLNVVIGMIVLLCAWLLVDFIMKTIYNDGSQFGPWNAILAPNGAGQCIVAHTPTPITTGTVGILTGVAPGTGTNPTAPGTPGTGAPTGAGSGTSGMNIQAAVQHLTQNAKPLNQYTGYCARAVCAAINAGGKSMGCANASSLGSNLTSAGFTAVYTGTFPSSFSPQTGDVVVFQPVAGHPYGHTAMYSGSQWISDAIQNTMASNQAAYTGGSFTIYRP